MRQHVIIEVVGKGYILSSRHDGQHTSFEYTTSALLAKPFTIQDVWHKEKDLNSIKNDLEARNMPYEELVLEWQLNKR